MSSQSEKQKNAVKQRMMRMLEENESVKERLAEAEREGERVREQLKEAEEKRANLIKYVKEQELEVDKVATELEASSAKLEEKYKVAEAVSGSHVGELKAKLSFMAIQKISVQKMKQKFGSGSKFGLNIKFYVFNP